MSQSVTTTGLNVAYLLQIETKRPTRPPTTTKVPVPIVVVLENVLCRGLSLAALADRVDHDVQ